MVWIMVCAVSLAGGILQTVAGFGAGILMMMVFPFFFNIVEAASLTVVVNYLQCLCMCWRYRRHIDYSLAMVPTVVYVAVSTVIIFTLGAMDLRLLQLVFGVFFIALSVYFLAVASHVRVRATTASGIVCGLLSGMLSGFFSVGGPPVALYFVSAAENMDVYMASLQFLFAVSGTVSILSRGYNGLLGHTLMLYAAAGTAAILVGMVIGQKIRDRLHADRLRTIVYVFVGVSGFINVLQNI